MMQKEREERVCSRRRKLKKSQAKRTRLKSREKRKREGE